MLWCREVGQVGSGRGYFRRPSPGRNTVLIKDLPGLADLDQVLFVDFPPSGKLTHPNAALLAKKAIESVKRSTDDRDRIRYLQDAMQSGVDTPLTADYAREILEPVGVGSLEEAREAIRLQKL